MANNTDLLTPSNDRPDHTLRLEGPHIILRGVHVDEDTEELYQNSRGTNERTRFIINNITIFKRDLEMDALWTF